MTSPTPPAHLPEARLVEIEARIAKATPVHVMTLVRAIQGAEREEYRAAQVFDAGPSMAADATHLSAIGACWATREAVEDLVAGLVADSSALVLAVRAARAEIERLREELAATICSDCRDRRPIDQTKTARLHRTGIDEMPWVYCKAAYLFPAGGGDDR